MSIEVIQQKTLKARKDYNCGACTSMLYVDGFEKLITQYRLSATEIEAMKAARDNGFKIKKGDVYIRQTNKYDGRIYTFRAIPAIHKICCDHEFYPED